MPAFNWQAATDPDGDAVTYDIYLDTETDPTTELAAGLSQTSYTAADRMHLSTPYHWKVVAKDHKNNETESTATFTFTTRTISKGTEAITNADFSARHVHSSVVYDNKIWVIGGRDGGFKNDVWNSTDGINWEEATPEADFSARDNRSSVVYDDKIWILGGYDDAFKNDVWYSSDGVTWEEAHPLANFPARYFHTSVVYDDKIWVMGGKSNNKGDYFNDVWYMD